MNGDDAAEEPVPFLDALRSFAEELATVADKAAIRQQALMDQLHADLWVRRSWASCGPCHGLDVLLAGGEFPIGPCSCTRPCDQPVCKASNEMVIPDALP